MNYSINYKLLPKNQLTSFALLILIFLTSIFFFQKNVLAETINQCEANQEVFGFNLSII